MKFIEKKCPNCGAGLKFDDNSSNVVCEYCSKTYYIQRDEKKYSKLDDAHLGAAYRFVDEYGKPVTQAIAVVQVVMMIVPLFIFFVAAGIIFTNSHSTSDDAVTGIDKINQEMANKEEEERKHYVSLISQIDPVSLETFHDTSKTKLANYNGVAIQRDYVISKDWESIGVYLLVGKKNARNKLYDIMSHTYKEKKTGKEITLYAAVRYEVLKLTDDGVVNCDYSGWNEVPSYDLSSDRYSGAYGYESVEKLYNQLIRSQSGDFTIEASEGLYIES